MEALIQAAQEDGGPLQERPRNLNAGGDGGGGRGGDGGSTGDGGAEME
jgi:hypothetical protein